MQEGWLWHHLVTVLTQVAPSLLCAPNKKGVLTQWKFIIHIWRIYQEQPLFLLETILLGAKFG